MKVFDIILILIVSVALLPSLALCQATTGIPLFTDTISPTNKFIDTATNKDTVRQKDLGDVLSSIFKKKSKTTYGPDSITSKPVYSGVFAVGYTLQTKLAAVISGNVAFRTAPKTRISTITANVTYTQNKQFYIPVQSNIWTKNNRFNFIGDFRFYKYPQSTFGLGSNSDIKDEDPMDYKFFRFYEVVLRQIKGNFYAGLGYILDYRWDISHEGNNNGTESDYHKYGTATHTVSTGITLNALYDSRDNPINASTGFYTGVQFRNNFTVLGSDDNWRSLILDVRKYFKLPGASENIIAFWSYNWLVVSGKPPYLDLPSNGWDSYCTTGRGYIQGRFRGAQMLYLESEYRFKLTRSGFLGGVLFANAETFSSKPGSSLEKVQPAFGAGLRIKLKKISKTNLSIDYGFGRQGSKGLFITVGEVF